MTYGQERQQVLDTVVAQELQEVVVTSGVITVTGEGKVAFSDGTKISLSDAPTVFETEVFDSNGIDKFKLRNLSGQAVSPLDSSNAKKILRRNLRGVKIRGLSLTAIKNPVLVIPTRLTFLPTSRI